MLSVHAVHGAALDAQRASVSRDELAAKAASRKLSQLRSQLERAGRPPSLRERAHVLWIELTVAIAALDAAFDHHQSADTRRCAHQVLQHRDFVRDSISALEFAMGEPRIL